MTETQAVAMFTLKVLKILLFIISFMFSISGDTCHRLRSKRGVAVDPQMCEFQNFTEEQESYLCGDKCVTRPEVNDLQI